MRSRPLLLSFVAITLITGFFYIVLPFCLADRVTCMGSPSDPITSPGLYRLLTPTLERFLAPTADPYGNDILRLELFMQLALIPAIVASLYLWLKRWTNPDNALIGVFIFGMVQLVAYSYWFRPVNMQLEILFIILALLCVQKPHAVPLLILTALATLNRETGVFVALIYIFYHMDEWRERRYQVLSVELLLTWAGITGGLHLVLGPAPHVIGGLDGTLAYNLHNWSDALFKSLLLVPLAVMIATRYRIAPAPLRRLMWVVVIYTGTLVVGAAWTEILRLCLPVMPLALPLLIYDKSGHPSAKMI